MVLNFRHGMHDILLNRFPDTLFVRNAIRWQPSSYAFLGRGPGRRMKDSLPL